MPLADLTRLSAIAAVTFVALLGLRPVWSQAVPPPPAPQEGAPPVPPEVAPEVAPLDTPLDEHKIDQFADAYLAIQAIHARAAAELKEAGDADAANEVKRQAETRIIEAVEQSGLRIEEFDQIADLMAVDLELRTKIARRVEERRRI